MKYKIGQEIEITEDFTLKTVGGSAYYCKGWR